MGDLIGFLFILGMLAAVAYAVTDQRRAKIEGRMRRLKSAAINVFPDTEEARIKGRIIPQEQPLVAPFSRRACLAWRVEVDVWETTYMGSNGGHFETLLTEEACADFIVQDKTGNARVLGSQGMQLSLDFDERRNTGLFTEPTPAMEAFLKERGHALEGGLLGGPRKFRFREGVVEVGETVAVSGVKHASSDSEYLVLDGGDRLLQITDTTKKL